MVLAIQILHLKDWSLSLKIGMQKCVSTRYAVLRDSTLTSAATLPRAKKWAVLSAIISQLLEKNVATSLSCPYHTENFNPNTSDDGVYEYACCVLSLALFMFEFRDAVKEGDGERVYRVWKYLLLLFRESGRTKYALEALNLHLQHYGLPPHLAFEITWS